MSKDAPVEQFPRERPVQVRSRRLADWINPTGATKVHSLIDKVYRQENLLTAWERVKGNGGSGGVDRQSVAGFEAQRGEQLGRMREELRDDRYQPQPVRQVPIPKAGQPGEYRMLGIPTVYDRVCQQALPQRLEPIFEPLFDDANYGYRRGRSTKDALCAPTAQITSGGGFHPCRCRLDVVADGPIGWVTSRTGAP